MRRKNGWWWLVVLAVMLGSGCAGILSETYTEDGRMERLRLGTTTKWSTWDRNPTRQDETSIMLKKESTF